MSCDPPRVNPLALKYVALKAEITSYDKFILGNALKIRVNVPDSLEYTYYDEAGLPKQKRVFVNSVQDLSGGALIYKFDTINGGVTSYKEDDLNFSYKLINNFQKRPFYFEQQIIPKTNGVFFAEFINNASIKIKINNDFEAQLSVLYDETVRLNTDMYCKYALISQPTQELGYCLSYAGRFYTFRVE